MSRKTENKIGFDVSSKTGLVTGANRGIGKAITEILLKHGAAKVYAAVRDPVSAEPLAITYGDRVVPLELDLTRRDTIQAAAEIASDAELVINNAGVLRTATALDDNAIDSLEAELSED